MVMMDTLTWQEASKIIRDHKSKQLLAFIIDYIVPEFEDWLKRYSLESIGKAKTLPNDIIDAVNVLAIEKIKRYQRYDWLEESQKLEKRVGHIADGKKDVEKQNALYVSVNESMDIINNPLDANKDDSIKELEITKRIKSIISIIDGKINGPIGFEYEIIDLALKLDLGKISIEEYKEKMHIYS
jgi:hypothetical protein